MDFQKRIYNLSKGVESLSKEEHGVFFDAMQRLSLSSEVKDAAIVLYLDFKSRPLGDYNASPKTRNVFLVASISLAAKALGDLRTDQEIESKMFVSREKIVDAEERMLKSFGIHGDTVPASEFVLQLTKRQIESMAADFAERGLISSDDGVRLVETSIEYLDAALAKGLNAKMSYRGRAAGVMFKAVRELGLPVSERDVARAAGFDRKTMLVNANLIGALLDGPSGRPR